MPNPRYVPRDYALTPSRFGVTASLEWKDVDAERMTYEQEDQLLAAKLQHEWCLKINKAISNSQHETVAGYADFLGKPVRQLIAKLNGEAVLRLEDIASAHRILGIEIPSP